MASSRNSEVARRRARHGILRRTAAAWGAVFALALGSIVATASFASEYDAAIRDYAAEAALDRAIAEVLRLMVDAETAQRGYALTGDPAFLGPYEHTQDELPGTWRDLHAKLRKRGEDAESRQLGEAIERRAAFTRDVIELVREGRADAARARIASGEGRRLMDRVRMIAASLEQRRARSLDHLMNRMEAARARTVGALILGALLVLGIAVGALMTVRRDLRAIDAATRAYEESERRMRAIADTSSDLVRVLERGAKPVFVSRSSEAILGYTPEEIMAMEPGALMPEADRQRVHEVAEEFLARGEIPPPLVHRLRRRDGTFRWFETRLADIHDEDGVVRRHHATSRDITARVERDREIRDEQVALAREAEELREMSRRDALTGLLNRRGLVELGRTALERASQSGHAAVLYFCDLDGLKQINDQLGHDEGDRAIKDAADILRELTRGSDLVARLGGDEMVVLGVVADAGAADAFAARVAKRIEEHDQRAKRPYRLSMSIGLARWSAGDPVDVDALIAAADEAMYEVKRTRATTNSRGEPIVRRALS